MRNQGVLLFCVLGSATLLGIARVGLVAASDLDLDDAWGSDTFTSSAEATKGSVQQVAEDVMHSGGASAGAQQPPTKAAKPKVIPLKDLLKDAKPSDFWAEGLAVAFMLYYTINIFLGGRQNKRLAMAWLDEYAGEGRLLQRNFAHVGLEDHEGKGMMMAKEGAAFYRLHASGRRYCHSMMMTMDLRPRQDLILGHLLAVPLEMHEDILDIKVNMSEAAMPQTVLCVATPRLAREMLRKEGAYEDLKTYTRKLEVSREKLPGWPGDRLTVLVEQAAVFYDIMTPDMMDLVFGRAAFEACGQYFRALRFSSEDAGKTKTVLQFSFALPPAGDMGALERWMTAVMAFIDIMGQYRLRPEQRAKAEKARAEAPKISRAETEEERLEKLEELRAQKKKEEQERLQRMSPEEREKYKARKAKVEQKRTARRLGKGNSVVRL